MATTLADVGYYFSMHIALTNPSISLDAKDYQATSTPMGFPLLLFIGLSLTLIEVAHD
jgi:hypothetical protein